jgi:hypothetical protein
LKFVVINDECYNQQLQLQQNGIVKLWEMLNLEFGGLEVRCYNSIVNIATTHSWVMSQDVLEPNPFKTCYVFHFISTV